MQRVLLRRGLESQIRLYSTVVSSLSSSSSTPLQYSHKQLFESPISTQDARFVHYLETESRSWELVDHIEPVSIYVDDSHSFFHETNRDLRLKMRDLTSVCFTGTIPLNIEYYSAFDMWKALLCQVESRHAELFGKRVKKWDYLDTISYSNLTQISLHHILNVPSIPFLHPRECNVNISFLPHDNSISMIIKTQEFSSYSSRIVPCHFFTSLSLESTSHASVRYHFVDIANMGGVLQYHGGIPALEKKYQIQRALLQQQTLRHILNSKTASSARLSESIPRLLWQTLQANCSNTI